jgi:hypothetical protein
VAPVDERASCSDILASFIERGFVLRLFIARRRDDEDEEDAIAAAAAPFLLLDELADSCDEEIMAPLSPPADD